MRISDTGCALWMSRAVDGALRGAVAPTVVRILRSTMLQPSAARNAKSAEESRAVAQRHRPNEEAMLRRDGMCGLGPMVSAAGVPPGSRVGTRPLAALPHVAPRLRVC